MGKLRAVDSLLEEGTVKSNKNMRSWKDVRMRYSTAYPTREERFYEAIWEADIRDEAGSAADWV